MLQIVTLFTEFVWVAYYHFARGANFRVDKVTSCHYVGGTANLLGIRAMIKTDFRPGMTLAEAVAAILPSWPGDARCKVGVASDGSIELLEHADGIRRCDLDFTLAVNGIAAPVNA